MKYKAYALLLCLLGLPAYADVEVRDAWLRAPIPGQSNTAGYLKIHNNGTTQRQLIAVESEFAAKAEIHTLLMIEGMARMRQLDSISIAPSETVELTSGGHHLMFFDLQKPSPNQNNWPLTLIFADGERISVALVQRSLSDLAPENHIHHQH